MFFALAIFSIAVVAFLLFLILFEPGLKYHLKTPPPDLCLESEDYLHLLGAVADAEIHRHSRVQVLTNGPAFYEAELAAIREAKTTVHLEAYIFYKSEIGRRYVQALTERAKAGVKVRLVIDYVGSFTTWDSYFDGLRKAGGEIHWYQPLRWYTFKRFNNRTHRELLIVDGAVGFIGGAGVGDEWFKGVNGQPAWRDTMFRVTGELVTGLQTSFAENWLESADEVLFDRVDFPFCTEERRRTHPGDTRGLVVISAPTAGRATRARVLFQTLLASARKTIHINSPYFLPDASTRREIIRAIKERGVEVKIITPGRKADHTLTRRSSRRRYGDLLKAGAQICEYQPAMIHAKTLVIDGLWVVVGSTNFDNRSFGLNDEVNLAAADRELAARLGEDFGNDLNQSKRITYAQWRRRPLWQRAQEWVGLLLERQQ